MDDPTQEHDDSQPRPTQAKAGVVSSRIQANRSALAPGSVSSSTPVSPLSAVSPKSAEAYDALNPVRIIETADALARRISERFAESDLADVAAHLVILSDE